MAKAATNEDDPYTWPIGKLRRKRDQEWEMAGLARRDGDAADELIHTNKARLYFNIIYDRG